MNKYCVNNLLEEINILKNENNRYKEALQEIERWDSMLYSPRELGNFAKKALGKPTIPLKCNDYN